MRITRRLRGAHLLSDGSAQWHAPEPQRTSIIGVGLAERAGAMKELAERIAGRVQLPLLPLGEPCPFLSTHGLSGQLWRASAVDGRSAAEIVILEDGRFHYPLWLEIDAARVADDLRHFAGVNVDQAADARPLCSHRRWRCVGLATCGSIATLPNGWCSTAPGVWRHVDGAVAELGRLVPMLTVARVMRHFVSSIAAGEVATVDELPVSVDGPRRLFRVVVARGQRLVRDLAWSRCTSARIVWA